MESFTVEPTLEQDILVMRLAGYLSEEGGKQLHQAAQGFFKQGVKKVLLEFSGCTLVNSPGVAAVMELAYRIVDDFSGKIVLCGLNPLQKRVFGIAGVFTSAEEAPSLDEGKRQLAG